MNGQFQIQYSEEIRSQGRGVSPAGRKALAIATTWMVIGHTISMCTVNPLSLENHVCEESPVFPHLSVRHICTSSHEVCFPADQ